jgi:hypothetical protein
MLLFPCSSQSFPCCPVLVYFSTFEPIELTQDSVMQQAGVPMLYDTASNERLPPCLYICSVENVLGRAPLFLCFVEDKSPHDFTPLQGRSASW